MPKLKSNCLLIALFFQMGHPAQAQPFSWLEDSSRFSKVAAPYPAFENWLLKSFAWSPIQSKAPLDPPCQSQAFQSDKLKSPVFPASHFASVNQSYYERCKDKLMINSNSSLLHNAKAVSFSDFAELKEFKRVLFQWGQSGYYLKGRLALKPGPQKRPLVIVRMGIFGNSEEIRAEKFLLQLLYENSPYHVLVIESTTGVDFLQNNHFMSAGGYEESFQTISVVRQILENEVPFSKQVSKVFLVGVSLAGHGVLHSLHLNEQLKKPLISKAIAICPLIDFKKTIDRLSERSIKTSLMDYWLQKRLHFLKEKEPELFVVSAHLWSETFFSRFARHLAAQFQGARALDPKLNWKNPSVMQKEINEKDFQQAQDVLSKYKNIQTPLLVIRTANDFLVDFDDNTKALNQLLDPKAKNNIGSILYQEGHHCTLPVAYRWDYLKNLFFDYLRD
jgi:predicted alpha/beta-fold hydrolase